MRLILKIQIRNREKKVVCFDKQPGFHSEFQHSKCKNVQKMSISYSICRVFVTTMHHVARVLAIKI